MKRILCIILTAALLLTAGAAAAQEQEEEKTIGYIVNETFDDVPTGEIPSSYKISDFSKNVSVEELLSASDKSLKFDIVTTDGAIMDKNLEKLREDVVFEFDIRFDSPCNGTLYFNFKNNNGKEYSFFRFDKLNLVLPSGESVFRCSQGKFYRMCVSVSTVTGLADIYVNHKKVANKILLANGNIEDFSIMRFHSRNIGASDKPVFYLDNLKIYKSELPIFKYEAMGVKIETGSDTSDDYVAEESAMMEYMGDAVALYVNQSKMFSHSEVTAVDSENPGAAPFVKDGRTLVPLRAIAEGFDAFVQWNDAEKKALINYEDSDIEMSAGEKEFIINGAKHTLDTAAEIYDGRIYVPLRALAEAFGKKVTYDKSGLIVVADRENFFNYRDDLCVFRTLAGLLVFHQPSGDEMVNMIKERYPENGHPRTFANKADIQRLQGEVVTNADKARWMQDTVNGANAYLAQPIIEYSINANNESHIPADNIASVLNNLAFTYMMTNDEKYAVRCLEEMKNAAAWPDWNPQHSFLDTATVMGALAFAYDWLYDYMTPEDRALIKTAIVEKGLTQVMEDYKNMPRKRVYSWAQSPVPDNWNIVCNSGALKAAMVVADEEPEISAQVFEYGMKHIQKAILMYGPDGAWYEGPNYWSYTTTHYTSLMASLDKAFGDTFGYMSTPGVAQTGYYIMAINGPEGTFNFHDAEATKTSSSDLFFFADKLGDGALSNIRLRQIKENNFKGGFRDILWYNTSLSGEAQLPLDSYFRDTEVATMRSGWGEDSSVFAAIHAGKVSVYHGHNDVGQFVIDGYGTRFACDLGLENYSTPGESSTKYRIRAEGHNTLVINPGMDSGQDAKGNTIINRFEAGKNSALSIIDMTSCYKKQVTSAKRGMKLTNNRNAIIVQDEVKAAEPVDLWWFMHSRQPIEVAQDGKSAVIRGEHRDMKVTLLGDVKGTFSVMDASPMETSPVNEAQNKNLLYSKLAFHAENVTDITIPVLMQFVLPVDGIETETYSPQVLPLDSWQLEETGVSETPSLTSLTLNGEMLEGFEPDKLSYTHRLTANEKMPQVSGSGNGKVTVKYKEGVPGYAVVSVSSPIDENVKTSYVINLVREVLSEAPGGAKQLSVASVSASSVPEPQNGPDNAIDDDLSTRWAAQGKANITLDLGSVQKIGYVGLAIYQDTKRDGRRQFFDILVSDDGESFRQVFSGESTGTTIEEEIFSIPVSSGRYVRIQCNGSSVGEWNSVTQCRIYGE